MKVLKFATQISLPTFWASRTLWRVIFCSKEVPIPKKLKVNNDASVPLGFSPKCNELQPVDCSMDDEDGLYFPGFCSKYNTNEAGDSAKEDGLTMRDLMNFSVGNSGNGKCGSDAPFLVYHHQL